MTNIEALRRCKRLFDEALPKFNYGASFLDANAIALLNEVPSEVNAVLSSESNHVAVVSEKRTYQGHGYGSHKTGDLEITSTAYGKTVLKNGDLLYKGE